MIRRRQPRWTMGNCKPRASGDDPGLDGRITAADKVNPARAGMILGGPARTRDAVGKPRASGDDPVQL